MYDDTDLVDSREFWLDLHLSVAKKITGIRFIISVSAHDIDIVKLCENLWSRQATLLIMAQQINGLVQDYSNPSMLAME